MVDRLKDKVALVSGAGSSGPGWGNGKATAVLFAREGAKVLAADINLNAALETKRIIEAEGASARQSLEMCPARMTLLPWSIPASPLSAGLTSFTTMSASSRSAVRSRPARRVGTGLTT